MHRSAFVALVLVLSSSSHAQVPAELLACGADCSELETSSYVFACREEFGEWLVYRSPWGRAWVGPIRYVGAFEVSIQARAGMFDEILPLFVQIRTDPGAAQCRSETGGPTWQTFGTRGCDPDSLWVTFPRVELVGVPLDTPYWVQVEGFLSRGQGGRVYASPYWRCIRVRAFPTMVSTNSWGHVKALYR